MAIPFYENVNGIALYWWQERHRPGSPHQSRIMPGGHSCHTHNFNLLLCAALNERAKGATHLCMVHADVSPEGPWLDTLLVEMEASGADVLAAVVPIKHQRGVTSTCFENDEGRLRRLTMNEAAALPRTFDAASAGFPGWRLRMGASLWLMDLRKPWVERAYPRRYTPGVRMPPYFEVKDRLRQLPSGDWTADSLSEDWHFSRMLDAHGARLLATRAVACGHWGPTEYRNDHPWGLWYYDEDSFRGGNFAWSRGEPGTTNGERTGDMDRKTIEARLAELNQLKAQQEQRLADARQQQQVASVNLDRIEGARQDCEFWLAQLGEKGVAETPPEPGANGECPAVAVAEE